MSRSTPKMYGAMVLWLVVVGGGLLATYAGRQGVIPIVPEAVAEVPEAVTMVHEPGTVSAQAQSAAPRLLMFVHPKCPCSRASLRELQRLMARTPVAVEVYFYLPEGEGESWLHTASWEIASATPGVTTQVDADGQLARRFAAQRSGEVVLLGAEGSVLYAGGITSAAGHEGDNEGRAAIEAHLQGRPAPDRLPVFGCEIF